MTPRLRTTGRLLCARPLLLLALLLGPAASGSCAYAAEPAPTRPPASDETQAGSDPGEGRTPPGRPESKPPDHDRPEKPPDADHPRQEHHDAGTPAAEPSKNATAAPSGSASPGRPNASPGKTTASPTRPSGSASAAAPKRPQHTAAPPRPATAPAAVPPEQTEARDYPDDDEVQSAAPPSGATVGTARRAPRQTVAEPATPVVGVLPLGSGLVLVGLGVGFLALRLRRT